MTLDGAEVPFEHPGKDLVVKAPVVADQRYVLQVRYSGTPETTPAPTTRNDFSTSGWTITPDGETGIDGVYPRGIPIGTVVSVEQGGQLFHRIQLAPAVDFGSLDQVYLLDFEAVPEKIKESRPSGSP